MSAGWALCWEMWARQRWLPRALVGYLLLMMLVVQTLPEAVGKNLTVAMMFPLQFALLVLIAGVCHGFDGKLEAPGSMLPGRLLVLPLSARSLVGWSMLGGAGPLALLWPLGALTVLWPLGARAPLVWPGLLIYNVIAWLQVLCWVPIGVPYLRMYLAGLGAPGLVALFGFLGSEVGVPEPVLAALLLGLALTAYAVAVAGVERARQGAHAGEASCWEQPIARAIEARPFPSPERALLWREWRVFRWWFFFVYAIALVTGLPFLYFLGRVLDNEQLVEVLRLTAAVKAVGPGWLTLAHLLLLPFLFGMTGWAEAGRVNRGSREGMSFVLARPVSIGTLVRTKFWLCAWAVLLGWAMNLGLAAAWAFPTGHWVEMSERLLAWSGSGFAAGLVLAAGLLALLALNWGQLAVGLWVGLSGRRWIETLAVAVGMVLLGAAVVLVGVSSKHPEVRLVLERTLPVVLVAAILGKTVLAVVVFRENLRRRLLSRRAVLLALGAWLALTAALFAGLAWLLPTEVVGRATLAEVVVLAVPIARIGLAPLALAWNRHR